MSEGIYILGQYQNSLKCPQNGFLTVDQMRWWAQVIWMNKEGRRMFGATGGKRSNTGGARSILWIGTISGRVCDRRWIPVARRSPRPGFVSRMEAGIPFWSRPSW